MKWLLLPLILLVLSGCSAKIVDISADGLNLQKDKNRYSFYPNGSNNNEEYYFVDSY